MLFMSALNVLKIPWVKININLPHNFIHDFREQDDANPLCEVLGQKKPAINKVRLRMTASVLKS
jgi:hypothetical protein